MRPCDSRAGSTWKILASHEVPVAGGRFTFPGVEKIVPRFDNRRPLTSRTVQSTVIRPLVSSPARALVLVAAILAGPGLAHAQRIDMRGTLHNLARGQDIEVTDARQICVFCHTPTDSDHADAMRPLWQPSAPEDQPFIMFDDIGQMAAGREAVGSQSIACLSCHDSTQAFGIAGGSEDHPFAVPYRGALTLEQRQRALEEAAKAGRLTNPARLVKFDADFRDATRGIVDNRPVWWVSKGTPSAQRGRLDIPLYVRLDPTDQAEVPFVECSSCHDPHTVRPLFLRTESAASELCLTCHAK